MPVPFEDRTIDVLIHETDQNKDKKPAKGSVNQHTWDFMKKRYTVIRNLVPKEIIDMTIDTWKAAERTPMYNEIVEHEQRDITFKNPESSIGKSRGGYCTPWGIALHQYVWKALEHYIDIPLRQTYSYTRKYERGAYLASHVDRPSCEISATICLDYKTDDQKPWPIWIRGDKNFAGWGGDDVQACSQKIPVRLREENNCSKVLLEPGDILLYQGPNAPHWRDYLLGDYSYHIFLHFYNLRSNMQKLQNFFMDDQESVIDAEGNVLRKKEKPAPHRFSNLELDGRISRFDPDGVRRPGFDRLTKEYEELKMHDEYKEIYCDIVNNYDNITKVEK
tara:strand:+ start:879 stop:1880 length:1002 start_codon:yes stop_codon:yes gene_type:complete